MSSKIEVIRVCEYCKKEFVAKTTVTRFCSHKCNSRSYKERVKKLKVEGSNKDTESAKVNDITAINAKEILTVKEVSILLNCSERSVHRYIKEGTIKAVNFGQRLTRVRRSDLYGFFSDSQAKDNVEIKVYDFPESPKTEDARVKLYDISECYRISEVQEKYNISSGALYNLIKRNNIPKINKGKFVYVPKELIMRIFG